MNIPKQVIISVTNGDHEESFSMEYAAPSSHPLLHAIRRLTLLGGVGSLQAIQGDIQHGSSLLRSLQRSKKVTYIGAGYFALAKMHILPVEEWLYRVLNRCSSPLSKERCIEMIAQQYPHGDQKEIEKWLQGKFKGIIVGENHIQLG